MQDTLTLWGTDNRTVDILTVQLNFLSVQNYINKWMHNVKNVRDK